MTMGRLMRALVVVSAAVLRSAAISPETFAGDGDLIWKATLRPCLTTLAPILMSFSFKLDSDQSLIGSGVASVRRKLPRL